MRYDDRAPISMPYVGGRYKSCQVGLESKDASQSGPLPVTKTVYLTTGDGTYGSATDRLYSVKGGVELSWFACDSNRTTEATTAR